MRWRIELSPRSVQSLRSLPRSHQKRVAVRIRLLEEEGIPEGTPGKGGTRILQVGDIALVLMERPEEREIVLVTLSLTSAPAATGIRNLAIRWVMSLFRGGWMESFLQDVRVGLRSLKHNPGFSLVAVLTLALGIGSATAIFSVANGVLLKPLPYRDSDQVVTVWASWDNFPEKTWLAVDEFQLFHQENRTFQDMALYQTTTAAFTGEDNPEQVRAALVTPNTFSVLGVDPVVGRIPTWEEARDSVPPVLIGNEVWKRRWGGDPGIVGSAVQLNGNPVPVAGVLPEGFVLPVDYASPSASQVFLPTYVDLEGPAPDLGTGGSHGAYGVGRLMEGRTVADARSDLQRVMSQVDPVGLYSAQRGFTPRVFPVLDDVVGDAKSTILLLLGAVFLVLLIACGNVANLLLARSEGRTREVAIRAAVGAGRLRIFRQLITENGILAILGGVTGVLLAHLGVQALLAIDPQAVPRAEAVATDLPVMVFALGASIFTALVFGSAPAFKLLPRRVPTSLQDGARGTGGMSFRLQGILVSVQMAMAVILLTASVLMIRTFANLMEVDPGFHPENVLTFRLTAPPSGYPDPESVTVFYTDLLREIRDIPGVEGAGAARILPLATTMGDAGFRPQGYAPAPNESTQAEWQFSTPGYLEVMAIPLLEGRTFQDRDNLEAQDVVIINESLARRYWGNRSPLGATVNVMGDTAVVVGVVGDVVHNGLTGETRDRFYRPHAQIDGFAQRSLTLTVASRGDPLAIVEPVRSLVRDMDPSIPVSDIRTMDEILADSVAQPRFTLVLLAVFASIALTLAVVGIYGVIAYGVNRRSREIGVRMALGAQPGAVVGMMVRQGLIMALLGIVAGTVVALGVTRFMAGLLYGVAPQDPLTFVAVLGLFLVVAALASWVPAVRAARVDPAHALRYD